MRFFSTNHQSPWVDFREATILGQAPDKGLYFPEHIPFDEPSYFQEIERFSNEEIAFRAIRPYTGDTIPVKPLCKKIKVVSADELFAVAIRNAYENKSINSLFIKGRLKSGK